MMEWECTATSQRPVSSGAANGAWRMGAGKEETRRDPHRVACSVNEPQPEVGESTRRLVQLSAFEVVDYDYGPLPFDGIIVKI